MSRIRGEAGSPYTKLYTKDFTALASVDIGVTAGAKTIGGDSATLLNAGFLLADPNGCKLVNGTGLVMTSDASTASTPDFNGNLGPALYWKFDDLLASANWGADNKAVQAKYGLLIARFIVDASDADASLQVASMGIANSPTYGVGCSADVGYSGAAAGVGSAYQVGAYASDYDTLANAGLSSLPECVYVVAAPGCGSVYFGDATGLAPSGILATRESWNIISRPIPPTDATGWIKLNSGFFFGLGDTGAAGVAVTLKKVDVWGIKTSQRLPGINAINMTIA